LIITGKDVIKAWYPQASLPTSTERWSVLSATVYVFTVIIYVNWWWATSLPSSNDYNQTATFQWIVVWDKQLNRDNCYRSLWTRKKHRVSVNIESKLSSSCRLYQQGICHDATVTCTVLGNC